MNKNVSIPFDKENLKILSDKCVYKSKEMKKIQYTDIKFRLIQVMFNMLKNKKSIEIEYCITSYVSGFINIIIRKIDLFSVYLSYSLKRKYFGEYIDNKKTFNLTVTIINCREKFDEGSIPELDKLF